MEVLGTATRAIQRFFRLRKYSCLREEKTIFERNSYFKQKLPLILESDHFSKASEDEINSHMPWIEVSKTSF